MIIKIFLYHLGFFFLIPGSETSHSSFSLNVEHKMNPEWSYAAFISIGSKIKCASLCHEDSERCLYFGYKEKTCHLIHSMHESDCQEDSCLDPGMKIYKLIKEDPQETTTEIISTTTEEDTTTSSQLSTTLDSTSTTTEASPSTITTTDTSSTTIATTTTDVPSFTTTTDMPTTTTTDVATSTTTEGMTTTEEPFNCDPPDGAEPEIKCGLETHLLNGLGSRSPFFGDILSPKCYDFKQKMYDDAKEKEKTHVFFSIDGGFTINAQCLDENHVIVRFKICVKDAHIPRITVHCYPVLDPDKVDNIVNATSDGMKHTLVDCQEKTALQNIYMMDSGNGVVTRVVFQCIHFNIPDNEIDKATKDTPANQNRG